MGSPEELGRQIYAAMLSRNLDEVRLVLREKPVDGPEGFGHEFEIHLVPYRSADDPRHGLLCDMLRYLREKRDTHDGEFGGAFQAALDEFETRIVELTVQLLHVQKADLSARVYETPEGPAAPESGKEDQLP